MALHIPRLVVVSLGGSLITKDEFNYPFLRSFRKFIEAHVRSGHKFIIVCGGGRPTRLYQEAARKLGNKEHADLDWLGIHATRLNAQLVRATLTKYAERKILKNPRAPYVMRRPVLIAAGWKPGFSTDYDAVILAHRFNVKTVVNLTGLQVHDKDPNKHSDAKPIDDIRWKDFFMMVGSKWSPGLNMPFDPIASRTAHKYGISVAVLGPNLKNFENYLKGRSFKGTIIR